MTDLPSLGPLQGDDKITLLCYTRFRFVFKFFATSDAKRGRIQSGRPYLSSLTLLLQKFLGNLQRYSMVKHHLIKPIQAMTIIFATLTNIGDKLCMRVELYGKKEKTLGEYLSGEKSDTIFPKSGPHMFFGDKARETV